MKLSLVDDEVPEKEKSILTNPATLYYKSLMVGEAYGEVEVMVTREFGDVGRVTGR